MNTIEKFLVEQNKEPHTTINKGEVSDNPMSNLPGTDDEGGNKKIKRLIIKLIKTKPMLDENDIDEMAEKLGIEHDDIENQIFQMFHKLIQYAPGKHMDTPDEKFDPEQLKMGIEIEKEHTDCPVLAKEIAKDHLAEIKNYYSRLNKMEKDAGVE